MKNYPSINLHFEITPNGRIKFNWKENDVKLLFYTDKENGTYCQHKPRKASTIRAVGEAFIKIADKAESLGMYD